MKNKRLIGILAAAALLLLIPFLADFVLAGVLLFGAGLVFEMILRTIKKFEHRIAISAVVLAALLLIWIELAVGLFGTRFAGN
jgi:hypothetical protein